MSPEEMAADAAKNRRKRKYRQVIQEYYRENGLQRPQRIIDELQASRILRAVYSERQLQEVMVDFWTNHFNIFANKGADRWLFAGLRSRHDSSNAMGKPMLLQATAESPAMLFYLDNFQSEPERESATRWSSTADASAATTATATATRHQRELRARADGAAHARRRWRLHTEGCAGSRALLHGLDHLQPRGGAAARTR